MNLTLESQKYNINIDEKMTQEFKIYADTLLEYNEVMNLTAITDREEIDEKHFLDSASALVSGAFCEGASVIDIGAGAGFPSLPLKIVRKDLRITMLDSLNKRVNFLKAVIEKLMLKDICAVHFRAEEGARDKKMRESFDVATARAVADLAVLAEYALPFVKKGGYFVAMKGNNIDEEVNRAKKAITIMGGTIESVKEIILPSGINHSLVIIRKTDSTPKAYPRKSGKVSREPIV